MAAVPCFGQGISDFTGIVVVVVVVGEGTVVVVVVEEGTVVVVVVDEVVDGGEVCCTLAFEDTVARAAGTARKTPAMTVDEVSTSSRPRRNQPLPDGFIDSIYLVWHDIPSHGSLGWSQILQPTARSGQTPDVL
jgi:hypothetical protein